MEVWDFMDVFVTSPCRYHIFNEFSLLFGLLRADVISVSGSKKGNRV